MLDSILSKRSCSSLSIVDEKYNWISNRDA